MISEMAVWTILILPLLSFVLIVFVIRPFFNHYAWVAGHIAIVGIGAALSLSLWALFCVIDAGGEIVWRAHHWLTLGRLDFEIGILMDPLTAIMLVVVTGVSLLVQVYSIGYMDGDRGYARYYAYMSLFTGSMLGLILANNIIQLFVFWELVGLCSYLLIGFWYHKPAAAAAAKKAFIVTRVGDFGFLLAIMYLFFNYDAFAVHGLNPSAIPDIYTAVAMGGVITSGVATWIAIGIFAGAVGKSGQFPLHTWLPDAMEGPTPVSALIHAATMVAAGVFLVARFFPLFEMSAVAMNTVALIGGFTAIFAASMGLVMNDLKRVLAYSTVSQLGYMMLALGVGAYGIAIFHLFTHAFFKALLFLGAGNVNHATKTFDMRYMGGLRRAMPWTYATFLIGSLSLAGIFPLSGFWSKDEILASAWGEGGAVATTVFWMALTAVFMTAFYMFRALFMTFEGEFRGGADAESGGSTPSEGLHLSESPLVMVAPIVLLGIASVILGFLVNPTIDLGVIPVHWLTDFLGGGPVHTEIASFNIRLAAATGAVAIAGIALASLMYWSKRFPPRVLRERLRPAYILLSRKYYIDEAYEGFLVSRVFYRGLARSLDWGDKWIIDRMVNWTGWIGANFGGTLRQVQTGQVQGYGIVFAAGVVVIFGLYLFFL